MVEGAEAEGGGQRGGRGERDSEVEGMGRGELSPGSIRTCVHVPYGHSRAKRSGTSLTKDQGLGGES